MSETEECVSNRLDCLKSTDYRVLNDLLLPAVGNPPTVQIDHVIISKFGLFCIKSVAGKGGIYGSAWLKSWKRYHFNQVEVFDNPIFQNRLHVEALESLLHKHFGNLFVQPLVVFTQADQIKVYGVPNYVVILDDLIPKIAGYIRPILTEAEMNKIEQLLLQPDSSDNEGLTVYNQEAERHVSKIESIYNEYDSSYATANPKPEQWVRKRIGRYTGIDNVYSIQGQMTTCVKCKLEYLTADALRERWPLWEGHCKRCSEGMQASW